jgi:pectinesterase
MTMRRAPAAAVRLALSLAGLAVLATAPAPSLAQAAPPPSVLVRVENPLQAVRSDEVVTLPWAALVEHLPTAAPHRVRVVDAATGAELPVQLLDGDAAGGAPALLVLASFWPGEAKQLRVEASPPAAPPAPRAYARHDAYRDDLAWETDRVAFRTYGQGLWQASEFSPLVSSGIDIWSKRVPDLIVDRWYEKGSDAYHIDTGEGADFYSVGESLGAGGSAIWRDGALHRASNFRSHRILASGPIRLVFELDYEPWDAGGVQVSERKRITMDAGQHLFRQDLTYRVEAGDAADLTYAVGTVKRAGLVGSSRQGRPWSWLSTWGPVERGSGGHGSLGTAVLMPRDQVVEVRETGDHYLMLARATPGRTTTQYAGAGWTAAGEIGDVEGWWAHLDDFARRLEHPVRVAFPQRPPASR